MYTHNQPIKLQHNEGLVKVNKETGDMKDVKVRSNNIPEGKQVFEPEAIFKKDYTISWKYLKDNLSHLELSAAVSLSLLAKANTNSLEPISSDTAHSQLCEMLNVSKNKIKKVLDTLFDYGVYGRFAVADVTKPYTKFWILNPYLSFSGKLIHSDIAGLFEGTKIALNFKGLPTSGRNNPTNGID